MPIFLFIAALIALDQAVKYWALVALQPLGTIPLLEGVFHLTYVENRGAAFSLFAKLDSRLALAALAVCVCVAILIALRKGIVQTALGKWSLYLIIAGALGNAIDRFVHGFVVDLFDFRLIGFPVFNVADIFICIGGVLFAVYVMWQHQDKQPEESVDEGE